MEGQARPPFRQDDEGPEIGKSLDVKRVSGKDRFSAAICSTTVRGYWSHWQGEYTIGCNDNPDECEGCKHFLPQRWHGFIHVCDPKGSRGIFLDLTKPGKLNLLRAVPEGMDLRGCVMWVTREQSSDKRPLSFEFIRHVEPSIQLPEEADAALLVARIWGHKKLRRQERGIPV